MATCIISIVFMSIVTNKADSYDTLHTVGLQRPVDGNRDGSFLTMWSWQGLMYGLVMMASSPGSVLGDQTLWQVRYRVVTTVRTYLASFPERMFVFQCNAMNLCTSLKLFFRAALFEVLRFVIFKEMSLSNTEKKIMARKQHQAHAHVLRVGVAEHICRTRAGG
jgi:hypothetical protein